MCIRDRPYTIGTPLFKAWPKTNIANTSALCVCLLYTSTPANSGDESDAATDESAHIKAVKTGPADNNSSAEANDDTANLTEVQGLF